MDISCRAVRHLDGAERKQDASVSFHPRRGGGFLDRPGDSGPGGIEQLMIRLVVRLRDNGLDLHARRGRTGVDWGQEVKVEIVARLRRRRIRLNRYEYLHWCEQGGVENGSLIDVFRVVWQAGYDGFAQSLQLMRFSQRGHSTLEFFANSRTLRLRKISRIRHTTKPNSGITVNRHHRSIGKHQLIERHVRRLRRGKVAI